MYKVNPQLENIVKKLGFKEVTGFGRLYYADTAGNVYSIRKSGKLYKLNQELNANGYWYIKLKSIDGKYKSRRVNRVIAETFIPNPLNLKVVHHKDHDRNNNSVDNLEWITHKENSRRRKDNEHRHYNTK